MCRPSGQGKFLLLTLQQRADKDSNEAQSLFLLRFSRNVQQNKDISSKH